MRHRNDGDPTNGETDSDDARVTEASLPISWTGWDQYDTNVFGFTNVIFLEDFGQFKADEKVGYISVDYSVGTLIEYAEDGTEIRKQLWRAMPVSTPTLDL